MNMIVHVWQNAKHFSSTAPHTPADIQLLVSCFMLYTARVVTLHV